MMKKLAAVLIMPSLALAAESPCDYDHRITGRYTKQIDRVVDVERYVSGYLEETRKCTVSMTAYVDGEPHFTEGTFTFTPDMTENKACGIAEQRAKENLIKKISPEVLSAKTDMTCGQRNMPATAGIGQYPPGTVIPIEQLNPYTVNQAPMFMFNPYAPVYAVDQSPPKQENQTWTTLDILRFGAAILPFMGK